MLIFSRSQWAAQETEDQPGKERDDPAVPYLGGCGDHGGGLRLGAAVQGVLPVHQLRRHREGGPRHREGRDYGASKGQAPHHPVQR